MARLCYHETPHMVPNKEKVNVQEAHQLGNKRLDNRLLSPEL